MNYITIYLITILWLPGLIILIRNTLWETHFLQSKEYRFDRLWTHIKYELDDNRRSRSELYIKLALFASIVASIITYSNILMLTFVVITLSIYSWESFVFIEKLFSKRASIPFLEPRSIVIILINLFVLFISAFLITLPLIEVDLVSGYQRILLWPEIFSTNIIQLPSIYIFISIVSLATILIDFASLLITLISNIISLPVEIAKIYVLKSTAKNITKSIHDLKVVGITGSYGKTTTKEILFDIVKDRQNTIRTSKDSNSIAQLANTIINQLTPQTDLLIMELGSYRKGEINSMTEIIKPDISIVTNVEYSHVGNHRGTRNLYDAKYELVENTVRDGVIILNGSDRKTLKMAKLNRGNEIIFFTSKEDFEAFSKIDAEPLILDTIYCENLSKEDNNVVFDLITPSEKIRINTPFSDTYLIDSIMPAIAGAIALGVELDEIREKLSKIDIKTKQITQYSGDNGVTILDNTNDSHLTGFKNALRKLKETDGRGKIVITKGIKELGVKKKKVYEQLAKEFQGIDIIITQDKKLREAIKESGLAVGIVYAMSNDEFIYEYRKRTSQNDVVLLEGRIPDEIKNTIIKES